MYAISGAGLVMILHQVMFVYSAQVTLYSLWFGLNDYCEKNLFVGVILFKYLLIYEYVRKRKKKNNQ